MENALPFGADAKQALETAARDMRDFCLEHIPGIRDEAAAVLSMEEARDGSLRVSVGLNDPDNTVLSQHQRLFQHEVAGHLKAVMIKIHDRVSARAPVLHATRHRWQFAVQREYDDVLVNLAICNFSIPVGYSAGSTSSSRLIDRLSELAESLHDVPVGTRQFLCLSRVIHAQDKQGAMRIASQLMKGAPGSGKASLEIRELR